MEFNLFAAVSKLLNLDLEEQEDLDSYLDFVLPKIRHLSEDLYEKEYYLDVPWLEVRDDENFHEVVLHIFKPHKRGIDIKVRNEDEGPEYLHSVDGNVEKGHWDLLPKTNKMLIKHMMGYELYELAFLNNDFFILKKHGDQKKMAKNKYLVLGREGRVRGYEWLEVVELLYNLYRNNIVFITIVISSVVLALIIIFLSI